MYPLLSTTQGADPLRKRKLQEKTVGLSRYYSGSRNYYTVMFLAAVVSEGFLHLIDEWVEAFCYKRTTQVQIGSAELVQINYAIPSHTSAQALGPVVESMCVVLTLLRAHS